MSVELQKEEDRRESASKRINRKKLLYRLSLNRGHALKKKLLIRDWKYHWETRGRSQREHKQSRGGLAGMLNEEKHLLKGGKRKTSGGWGMEIKNRKLGTYFKKGEGEGSPKRCRLKGLRGRAVVRRPGCVRGLMFTHGKKKPP